MPFSNAVYNLRQLKSSPASWTFALGILAVHALVEISGGDNRQPAFGWFGLLGLTADAVSHGDLWQLVSYGFLHGNWIHVGLNALFILLIGSRIEHMAGSARVVQTILLGILAGGIAHVSMVSLDQNGTLLVGISGGCVALLLVLTTLSPDSRMMPLPVSAQNLGIGILTAELLLALVDPNSSISWLRPFGKYLEDSGLGGWFAMGHACHFGGGIAGILVGRWILRPRVTLKRLRRDQLRREAKIGKKSNG